MADSIVTGTLEKPVVQEPAMPGLFTPRALVDLLFSRAAPKLSDADLMAIITGGAAFAETAASYAAEVAEGVGCLVAHDAIDGPGAGNFQAAGDVSILLFNVRDQFLSLEGVTSAINWAAAELKERRLL